MAVFRKGIKIAGHDIRLGFPRDKSLVNVTQDPRLKTRNSAAHGGIGNTENTIGRFTASMNKAEGFARAARYAVQINLPTSLEKIGINSSTVSASGGSSRDKATETTKDLNILGRQMGQQVNLHCDSITMPGHDLTTTELKTYGPGRQIVSGHAYNGTINASFYADTFLRERHFFERWQKACVDNITNKVGYYNDYVGTMKIMQLSGLQGTPDESDGIGAQPQDAPTYAVECTEVYPEQVGAIEYDYSSANTIVKINVQLQYRSWYNLTTESINEQPFGDPLQTIHSVKEQDRGIIGGFLNKLPPELQRAARDVYNTQKQKLPLGKVFKGKIFPPF
tara:strand:- start:1 stop:1008 length:1008 start_codon:yes stop_codon:yes gene_type:complete